jgi:hypothetical protein
MFFVLFFTKIPPATPYGQTACQSNLRLSSGSDPVLLLPMPTMWLRYGGSRSINVRQETPGTTVESDDGVPGAPHFDPTEAITVCQSREGASKR